MSNRYYARSASDKTDDWPLWFVAYKTLGGLNVTDKVSRMLGLDGLHKPGATLCFREYAEQLAADANKMVKELNNA